VCRDEVRLCGQPSQALNSDLIKLSPLPPGDAENRPSYGGKLFNVEVAGFVLNLKQSQRGLYVLVRLVKVEPLKQLAAQFYVAADGRLFVIGLEWG
jgi:hypothetical protein